MNTLVIGSGGREHAIAWKLRQSPKVKRVFVAPGNAGTSKIATNVAINPKELDRLVDFARDEKIDLTVVGPDDVLAAGCVDTFQRNGLRIFGVCQAAARLESSKSFAKEFMVRHGIPTAHYAICSSSHEAFSRLDQFGFPVVIKADGLALGKGVIVARDEEEARKAIRQIMEEHRFGSAGSRIVIEEFLSGPECSVHALVDGKTYLNFPTAQDHKQLYDGNQGPNTGGMGTFSPSNRLDPKLLSAVETQVLQPFVKGIQEEGIDFRGLLFPGLMLTATGIKVLEFNCRFGDPETQVLLPRLRTDLVDLLEGTIDGRLDEVSADWATEAAVCVVLASGGYPDGYETGKPIVGIEEAEKMQNVVIFHAGTRSEESRILTSGGRVLGVAALGGTLSRAKRLAYDAVEKIEFDGRYFRHDIAAF